MILPRLVCVPDANDPSISDTPWSDVVRAVFDGIGKSDVVRADAKAHDPSPVASLNGSRSCGAQLCFVVLLVSHSLRCRQISSSIVGYVPVSTASYC